MDGGTVSHALGWLIAALIRQSRRRDISIPSLPPPPPTRTVSVTFITTFTSVVNSAHATPPPPFDSRHFDRLSYDITTSSSQSLINGITLDNLRQWIDPYTLVLAIIIMSLVLNIVLSWSFARQLHAAQKSDASSVWWKGEAARVADACEEQVKAEREQMTELSLAKEAELERQLKAKEKECEEQLTSSRHMFEAILRAKDEDLEAHLMAKEDEFDTEVKALTAAHEVQMKTEVRALDVKYWAKQRMAELWLDVKEDRMDDLRLQNAEMKYLLEQAEEKASAEKTDLLKQISEKEDLLKQTHKTLIQAQDNLRRAIQERNISDRRLEQCSPKQVAHLKAATPKASPGLATPKTSSELSISKASSELSIPNAPSRLSNPKVPSSPSDRRQAMGSQKSTFAQDVRVNMAASRQTQAEPVREHMASKAPHLKKQPVFMNGMHHSRWAARSDDVASARNYPLQQSLDATLSPQTPCQPEKRTCSQQLPLQDSPSTTVSSPSRQLQTHSERITSSRPLALHRVPDSTSSSRSPYQAGHTLRANDELLSGTTTTSPSPCQPAPTPTLSDPSIATASLDTLGSSEDDEVDDDSRQEVCYYRMHTEPGEAHTCSNAQKHTCNGKHVCVNTQSNNCTGEPLH